VLGRVADGGGNSGVSEAMVTLSNRQGGARAVLTDPQGRFVFFDVADGTYTLEASKPGFIFGSFGQRQLEDRGSPLVVAAGRAPAPIVVPLWRGGEISGVVTDDHGEPVAGCMVQIVNAFARAGRRRWITQATPATITDDRGRYRLGNVYPADVMVLLTPSRSWVESEGERLMFEPVLYPTARTLDAASVLPIKAASVFAGTDFRLVRRAAYRVTGRVAGPGTKARLQVRISRWDDDAEREIELGLALTGAAGEFAFEAIPPGTYRLSTWLAAGDVGPGFAAVDDNSIVRPPPSPTRLPDAAVRLTISDRDVTNVPVPLPGAGDLFGRLVFKGSTPPSAQVIRSLTLLVTSPAGSMAGITSPDATGAFRLYVAPGTYFIRFQIPPAPWALQSISVQGKDAMGDPIVIDHTGSSEVIVTFADESAELSGTVRAADGAAVPSNQELSVFIFPVDRATWTDFGSSSPWIRDVRVSTTGAFTARGVLPGEYFVLALPTAAAGTQWQLATTLEKFARTATRVRVTGTEKVAVDLRAGTGR
jgi:hypothetical protein